MADNFKGSTRSPIASDDIGGAHYQRVKVSFGANNAVADVSTAAPLPTRETAVGRALSIQGVEFTP